MKITLFLLSALFIQPCFAEYIEKSITLHNIKLIMISATDKSAVIKTYDNSLQLIKVGDHIGANGRIVEIAKERVLIEEIVNNTIETIIIRLEDGKQTVERHKKLVRENKPLFRSP